MEQTRLVPNGQIFKKKKEKKKSTARQAAQFAQV